MLLALELLDAFGDVYAALSVVAGGVVADEGPPVAVTSTGCLPLTPAALFEVVGG